ncbi:MAG: hypothetical protein HY329_09245 [Chloroflexi bacterium]|nr:hypothetical protein [Chloroflexota bacterium]
MTVVRQSPTSVGTFSFVVLDPTQEPDEVPFELNPRVSDLTGLRVGLVDNGKHKSKEVVQAVADLLNEKYRFSSMRMWRKESPAKAPSPDQIAEMKETCDVVIAGIGD